MQILVVKFCQRFDIRGFFLACFVVSAQDDLAVGTFVFDVLETVHTEGDTEAGPEHGEAEDQTEAPGHHAGLGGGAGGDLHLTTRTHQAGRLGTKLGHWNLKYQMRLIGYLSQPLNRNESMGKRTVTSVLPCFIRLTWITLTIVLTGSPPVVGSTNPPACPFLMVSS